MNRPMNARSPSPAPTRTRRALLPILAFALAIPTALALFPAAGQADEAVPPTVAPAPQTPTEVSAAVDAILDAQIADAGIEAAPQNSDLEFLRRLHLDVLGTIPSAEEAQAFAADRSPDKRARKLDELLAGASYGEYWGTVWYGWLTELSPAANVRGANGARFLSGPVKGVFTDWLKEQMATNRPYDEFVHDMLTASGRTDENGATGYYARWAENVNNLAGATAKIFLGTRIQCAQCHDHIYEEDWKQKDFQGMAAFFATTNNQPIPEAREYQQMQRQVQAERLRQSQERQARERGELPNLGRDGGEGMDGGMDGGSMEGEGMDGPARGSDRAGAVSYDREEFRRLARLRNVVTVEDQFLTQRQIDQLKRRFERRQSPNNSDRLARLGLVTMTPKLWMADEMPDLPGIPRRYLLAQWTTDEENRLFAEALVNRYWGHFTGRGFVNPIDDFNSFNPPSHPEAMALLADSFIASGFDLQQLIRTIVGTKAYQRSSHWHGDDEPSDDLFARALVRPLDTVQLYQAVTEATGIADRASRAGRRAAERLQQTLFAAFSFVFDDDEGAESQDFEGSIPQGLFLLNGQLSQSSVSARRGTRLSQILDRNKDESERITALYWTVYGRAPSESELTMTLGFIEAAPLTRKGRRVDDSERRAAYEDLLWALLNSTEFTTNH